MYYLKTIVKKILNFFNLEILPVDNRKAYFIGPTKTTRSYGTFFKRILLNGNSISNDEIIKKLIKTDSPIIFDVGASHGDSIERFKALFQNSYIYSFEPLRKEFDLIKKKETDKIKCFNFAFGDVEEEKKFNVHDSMSFFSSFNKYNDQYFKPGDNKFIEKHRATKHLINMDNHSIEVNSFHTYKIIEETVNKDFEIFARCKDDNSIEGMRNKQILGMMWHPERDESIANWNKLLIEKFITNER